MIPGITRTWRKEVKSTKITGVFNSLSLEPKEKNFLFSSNSFMRSTIYTIEIDKNIWSKILTFTHLWTCSGTAFSVKKGIHFQYKDYISCGCKPFCRIPKKLTDWRITGFYFARWIF